VREPKDCDLMPFGRYKGTPVRQVAESDLRYSEWLLGQAWFKTKFPAECRQLADAVREADDSERTQRLHDEWRREIEIEAYGKVNPTLAQDLMAPMRSARMPAEVDGGCIVIPFPIGRIARRSRVAKPFFLS
jgi:hypothetical protein